MKPITAEERRAWGLELAAVTRRPASERHHDKNGVCVERIFAPYVNGLDVPEVKLLILECLRRLMRNRTHEHKVSITAWVAQAARSLMTDNFEKADAVAESRSRGSRKGWETKNDS